MAIDIILYAVLAAGLVVWLRNILGTHHGGERSRPNPFAGDEAASAQGTAAEKPASAKSENQAISDIKALAKDGHDIYNISAKAAEQGLLKIAERDKDFAIKGFLKNAQDAFVIIVEAYAGGDRETLGDLVTKQVLGAFEIGIKAREDNQEKQETEIRAFEKIEILDADLDKRQAFVTLKFEARETSVIKDAQGEILDGHPEKTTKMRDIWVFTRDTKSRDPRWLLCETRPCEDDNDLIPNTETMAEE